MTERLIELPDGYHLQLRFDAEDQRVSINAVGPDWVVEVEGPWRLGDRRWKLRNLPQGVAKALQVIEQRKLAQRDFEEQCETATESVRELAAVWSELVA